MKMKSAWILLCLLFVATQGVDVEQKRNYSPMYRLFRRFFPIQAETFPPVDEITVIGASYPRTGTTSMKAALEILGFRPYDFDDVSSNNHLELLEEAFFGDDAAVQRWFDAIMHAGFSTTYTLPTCLFFPELHSRFPNAKVISVQRDLKSWIRSMKSVFTMASKLRARPFRWCLNFDNAMGRGVMSPDSKHSLTECIPRFDEGLEFFQPWYMPWIYTPTRLNINETACMNKHEAHLLEVRRLISPENLLEMKISDGWEPLCEFLGKPIPNEPFPRDNSSEQLKKLERLLVIISYIYPFIAIGALLLLYGAFKLGAKAIDRMRPKAKTE